MIHRTKTKGRDIGIKKSFYGGIPQRYRNIENDGHVKHVRKRE